MASSHGLDIHLKPFHSYLAKDPWSLKQCSQPSLILRAQPKRQPCIPQPSSIPSSSLIQDAYPHFATAALSTCVRKKPPFVLSITC